MDNKTSINFVDRHDTATSTPTSDLFLVDSVCFFFFYRRPTHLLAGKEGIEGTTGIVAAQLRREEETRPGCLMSG